MAIFRGTGGSGDATVDATNQSSIAVTQAANASASATSASGSASTATTQATNASASATSASGSASTATTQAANASASALAAAISYDDFDDRYLGAKASEPTLDNDGNTLIVGALYFNSTNNTMYNRTSGSTWVSIVSTVAGSVVNTPSGNIAATNVQTALNELDTEKANLASPTFTGTPTLPTGAIATTQTAGNNTTALATTAFVIANVPATATTLTGDESNWATNRSRAVANMLSWKNYGNNHVIFDASGGTSPTGLAIDNTNSSFGWSATFGSLMGWNGTDTYGVRVDSARIADTAIVSTTQAKTDNSTKIATTAMVQSVGLNSAGYANYTVSTTLTSADLGRAIYYYGTSPGTLTLPPLGTCPDGSIISISCLNTGACTVTSQTVSQLYVKGENFTATSTVLAPGDSIQIMAVAGSFWVQISSSVLIAADATKLGGTAAASYALLASPTFTGTPTLPTGAIATTQTAGNNTTALATTAFVTTASTGKIQPIAATVATNALTLTLNPTTLDFRSTTLGSGTVATRTTAVALSMVVPSTATLGTVSAVKSRLVVVAIDNAGTLEVAVVNIAGGNDLSETGLISTTAISAAATASNVFYSTTARTSVAYRVVGYVESTQATAGTWATAPSTIQGAGGQALVGLGGLINIQYFTASGTYTPTAGTSFVIVELLGGGAGGRGGGNATSTGGGAGGFGRKKIMAGFSEVTVTIGAGGAGGTGNTIAGLAGNSGGTSSFGALISCTGGGSLDGGTASLGDLNITGAGAQTGNSLGALGYGSGSTYSAGGVGGGAGTSIVAGGNGAVGKPGLCIVWEYK